MKKLLILSGKGGTGKTTTAAAFMRFSGAKALADCDVDAPNLHLVMGQKGEPEKTVFYGSDKAQIDPAKCTGCGKCMEHCRFDAIRKENGVCQIAEHACEGCGVCVYVCPVQAVELQKDAAGMQQLYTDNGVFSTARLRMGRGNSGKLVTAVKFAMLRKAQTMPDAELAVIDGSPGIGCPVIASISGVDLVLIVAEPSMSGISDLQRLITTADGFRTKTAVCVNKWDASPENTAAIRRFCAEHEVPFAGTVPYDRSASAAINAGKSIADVDCPARDALWAVYCETRALLGLPKPEKRP